MGNKQSGVSLTASHPHVSESTSRSFSWQPDPLYVGEPVVKRGESFTASASRPGEILALDIGSTNTIQRAPSYSASSEYGSPGVYRHRQQSAPNLANNANGGNGSVVRGDAAFGGVQKELLRPALKNNSTNSTGKTGHSVNTADSGYMTEIATHDSDNSARARLRGSRLSLNDAMLGGGEFVQQPPHQMMHPMQMGPHFMPMHHPGMIQFGPPPPGAVGFMPPDQFLFPPQMLNARGMPLDEKKAKKLRKKQQKNQQQLSRHASMLGEIQPGEFIPPGSYSIMSGPVIAYGPHHGPQMGNFRSRSIDNFMAAGLIQPPPAIMAPPHHVHGPPGLPVRRYNSHVDLSGMGMGYQTMQPGPGVEKIPTVKKERKYEKRKDQQHGSLRDSSLSSTRGRLSDAGFNISKNNPNQNKRTEISTSIETHDRPDSAPDAQSGNQNTDTKNRRPQRPEVIYETLKGAQRALLATSAEINTIAVDSEKKDEKQTDHTQNVQDSPPPPAPNPKPVVITPEAKTILERNARILVEAEFEKDRPQQTIEINLITDTAPVESNKKQESNQIAPMSKLIEDLRKIPTPPPPPPMPPMQTQRPQKEAPKQELIKTDSVGSFKKQEHPLPKPAVTMQISNRKQEKSDPKPEPKRQHASSMMSSDKNLSSSSDERDDIESMIEATLNPIMPRRKFKRPKDFEPLDAWRGINVQQELAKRQPQRLTLDSSGNRDQQSIVEERIQVRLVPSAPSRREHNAGEPIYLEYDERLPEFKKRLIETGSFDIPEADKFHPRSNSQPSAGSRHMSPTRWDNSGMGTSGDPYSNHRPQQTHLWRDYVAMEEAVGTATGAGHGSVRSRKTIDSNKGSLRRLKDSVASIFRTKSSDQLKVEKPMSTATDEMPPMFTGPPTNGGRYAPSLTPSTSKIKAGDSSDIDFSWVHDLETRFRLEREQFERELQTLKQKSATLQRNDYMLSPKLQRQHSYQPRPPNPDTEPARSDDRFSPSLRSVPITNGDRQAYYQNNHYREKSVASSVDLAMNSARTAQTPPPPGRMSVYHSQQAMDDEQSRLINTDQQSKSRYFGVYDTSAQHDMAYRGDAYERSFRNELQQLAPVNVRQKAALFENETQRVQREMEERNQHLTRQKQQRSSSAPQRQPYRLGLQAQRSIDIDEPIYIPRPDYDGSQNRPPVMHARQNSAGRINGNAYVEDGTRYKNSAINENDRLFAPPFVDEPLIVNTTANAAPRVGYGSSPRSPSERKLARFYNSQANISSPNGRGLSGGRYESQPVLGSSNASSSSPFGQRHANYSPSRSPGLRRANQQQYEANRNNVHWSRNVTNGFDGGGQQQPMMRANRIGQQRMTANATRGVAFANE